MKKFKQFIIEEKKSIVESFAIDKVSGMGITLTAKDLGMKAQSGFELHPSVTEEDDGKATKAEAKYVNESPYNQACKNCTMFIPPHGCTGVKGTINPAGWCKFYEAKSSQVRRRQRED